MEKWEVLDSLEETKEKLERIENVLNQGADTESQDLDLLRHDLENDIIAEDEEKFYKTLKKENLI